MLTPAPNFLTTFGEGIGVGIIWCREGAATRLVSYTTFEKQVSLTIRRNS